MSSIKVHGGASVRTKNATNPATQAEVDAGTATGVYVSPKTLNDWTGPSSGDVVGPASATDSNFAAFDTTTGKLIKDSGYNGEPADFAYNYDNAFSILGSIRDFRDREFLRQVKYRLKPSHVVGSGGSDYIKALENIAAFSSGEVWIKFTGDDMDITLERKVVVTTGTLSTVTAGVRRNWDFQRFKNLIPKMLLKSGTGAATVDVEIGVYNPKTMAETRVVVERWTLDDATTFGDKPWYPPRVSSKFLQGIISHPFNDRMYLVGVSGTLNDADYTFEHLQVSYAAIKTSLTISASNANDRGYVVVPFTCELANCLQITLNNSAGTSTITDQFVKINL